MSQLPHPVHYRYVKASLASSKRAKRAKRILPSILITLGSLVIANVAWPILKYHLITVPQIARKPIVSPFQTQTRQLPPTKANNQIAQVLGETTDYTNAASWFPTAPYKAAPSYEVKTYLLSIPAVDIDDAVVDIGGESLDRSLIQFPGTANPGQLGSPVIFGHSVLRDFYDPRKTNPRRYTSIFSKIMTLKKGDQIIIDYDNIRYTYAVREKAIVEPEDVFILQQRFNTRELKLITCVPEGTYLHRGVIIADLVNLNQN